jgi:hypothetical protein
MPVHYERDDARRRIVATSVGRVTLADTLATIDRQAKEGAWSYGVLYDARGAEDIPTQSDLKHLVLHIGKLTTKYGPRGPVALVVLDRTLTTMARRYGKLAALTALDVRAFTTMEEAERWLETKPSTTEGTEDAEDQT